jgi:hypothetical protein
MVKVRVPRSRQLAISVNQKVGEEANFFIERGVYGVKGVYYGDYMVWDAIVKGFFCAVVAPPASPTPLAGGSIGWEEKEVFYFFFGFEIRSTTINWYTSWIFDQMMITLMINHI